MAIGICPIGIIMRARARSAYKARPLAFKEKMVATTMVLVAGLKEMTATTAIAMAIEVMAAKTETAIAITTAEEIPAIIASLAITLGEIAIITKKEEEEDTINIDMGILECKEEIKEE